MKILMRYFGPVRELTGKEEEELDVTEGITVAALRREIVAMYPSAGALAPSCRCAVDMRYAADDEAIPSGAEVAFIPPVAGG